MRDKLVLSSSVFMYHYKYDGLLNTFKQIEALMTTEYSMFAFVLMLLSLLNSNANMFQGIYSGKHIKKDCTYLLYSPLEYYFRHY